MRTRYAEFFALCCTLVLAAVADAQETGTAARLGMGARPLALGGAFVSVVEDASAVFWNPAGLARVQRAEVQLHYRRLSSTYSMDSANVSFGPARHGMAWGATISVLHRAGIPAEDVLNGFQGEPGASEFSGQLVVAFRPHKDLALGIGVGPILSSINRETSRSMGWGSNAGFLWSTDRTSVGFAILGLTAGLGTPTAPQSYRYRLSTGISHRLNSRLLLAAQLDRDRGAEPSAALGAEWHVHPALAIRAGIHQAIPEVSSIQVFSNGLGYHQGNFQMDYAVRFAQTLSPEHLLTLRFKLGSAAGTTMHQDDESRSQPAMVTHSPEDTALPVPIRGAMPNTGELSVPHQAMRTLPVGLTAITRSRRSPGPIPPAAGVPSENISTPTRTPVAPIPTRFLRPSKPVARRPLPMPMPEATTPRVQYVVRAGVHEDLDSAALEIARFYRAQIRPDLERRGELFIVVIKRCDTRAEAREWVARVAKADLRCIIDEE